MYMQTEPPNYRPTGTNKQIAVARQKKTSKKEKNSYNKIHKQNHC